MKKLILAAMTASLLATPMAASAQSRTVIKERYTNWQRGQRFDRNRAPNYRQIDYRAYRQRGVYAPPRGYQWVQSGNDAVLIAIASGLIGAVVGGALLN